METTVEKLEAMFLKSEADLEYIERRLRLDFINNTAENGCSAEDNMVVMLENLKTIKAKHSALCSNVREISRTQKESMDSIRSNLSAVSEVIQHCHQTSDFQVVSLTESEQESAALLGSAVTTAEMSPAIPAAGKQHPKSCEHKEVSAALLEAVPLSVRSNIKLADINAFYQELQQHLSRGSSGSLSLQKMKQLKLKVSEAKLKVLQHLGLVELDRRGQVRLVM
ncbi:SKA complex subunit 2 [Odontesthes bonariensis]|uniref:SKA complex subunit 2 n=1 Tax=Odontesthes bonariensis TaxID=219752 RepID=UPI003F587B08